MSCKGYGPSPPVFPVRLHKIPSAPPFYGVCDGDTCKEANEDKQTENHSGNVSEVPCVDEKKKCTEEKENCTEKNKNNGISSLLEGVLLECPICNLQTVVTDASACPCCRQNICRTCWGQLYRKADTSEGVACPYCRHKSGRQDLISWQPMCSDCSDTVTLERLTKLKCGHMLCNSCQKKQLADTFKFTKYNVKLASCTACEDYKRCPIPQQKKKSKRNKFGCGLFH